MYRDVEHIEPLTKDDMLEFYQHYVSPSSKTRTKAAVYLVAQASAEDVAAKLDPAQQKKGLMDGLTQLLTHSSVAVDEAALTKRFENVDVTGGDMAAISSAMADYLKESAGVAAEQAEQMMQQGQVVLAQMLPSLGIKPAGAANVDASTSGEAEVNGVAEKKTVVIEDVKAFKASLPLSAGPEPVRHLSEFEDLEPKL